MTGGWFNCFISDKFRKLKFSKFVRPIFDCLLTDRRLICVSGRHALIEYKDSDYRITATGSNGVFINHSDITSGRNQSTIFDDDDLLRIGDYEIAVRIDALFGYGQLLYDR